MDVTAAAPRYAFGNDSEHAPELHRCLAALLDPAGTARLASTGVGPGWRCLDVGAGAGSVARWLAARVAPGGHVLATDINPVHLDPAPGLAVARHDIVRDPLPDVGYDLVHARLVLQHLPQRQAVLARLVQALRPGGWLQVDEFDASYGTLLSPDGDEARELYGAFLAAQTRVLVAAGGDPSWAPRVPAALRAAGLVGVDPQLYVQVWRAGSPGARLLAHHTRLLRAGLLAAGLTEADLAAVRALLADPAFAAASCVRYCVQGHRPL